MSLHKFIEELEKHRKTQSEDDFDNRLTHCYLEHTVDGVPHRFEVRGWGQIENGALSISIVNWTICAGTASLELTEERVADWKILEEPCL